jgi:hypothetical protein
MLPDSLKRKNVTIFGGSQQGKTVVGNQAHAESDRVGILFAPDPEPWMRGQRVRSIEGIVAGLQQGREKFVYALPSYATEPREHFERLAYFALSAGEQHGLRARLTVDEAHEVAREGEGATPLQLVAKRGLKRGIQVTSVTQDPATFPLTVTRQSDALAYVGPASTMTVEYLSRKKIDASAWTDADDHEVRVIDRQGTLLWSGYADNRTYGGG